MVTSDIDTFLLLSKVHLTEHSTLKHEACILIYLSTIILQLSLLDINYRPRTFLLIYLFNFSDITIARAQVPKDISLLAQEIGLTPNEVSQYGSKKAKVSLKTLKRLQGKPDGKYVVVAG